jgi:hypothetical protein
MQNAGANFQFVYRRWNFWNNHAVAIGHEANITVAVSGVNWTAEGYSAPPFWTQLQKVTVPHHSELNCRRVQCPTNLKWTAEEYSAPLIWTQLQKGGVPH